jgi:integrase/recombinase XerD
MTPLRQRFIDDLRLRHYSAKTMQVYVDAVAAFAKFCGRSPEKLGPEDVRRYLLHLIHERGLSRSQYVINLHALRNLYHVTLGRPGRLKGVPFPRRQRKLPVVLSRDEVRRLFAVVTNLKHKAVFMVAYDSGLRISEILNLRAEDIDSQRMVIRIRQGKGNRDRYARLTPGLLELLREYWRSERPRTWLFPGADGRRRYDPSTPSQMLKMACRKAGITKRVSMHALRLLGHTSINTTALYTHVSVEQLRDAPSTMELLERSSPPQHIPGGGVVGERTSPVSPEASP